MMKYFDDDNGYYRNHGEAVKKGNQIIYSAPESVLVPSLMKSLFKFMKDNENNIHPLILSSIFHYYFVYIHPFSDGNGRIARFWVSLILTNWNSKFEYIPIEEEIYLTETKNNNTIKATANTINGILYLFLVFSLVNKSFSLIARISSVVLSVNLLSDILFSFPYNILLQ